MNEIRVCENCKYHNAINNLECEKCGFDLSFVIPIDEREIEENKVESAISTTPSAPFQANTECCNWIIVSMDDQLTIPIYNELVIGRDGVNGSYFDKSKFVSRKHAVFYVENDDVFIFDASTNGTFLNDKRLPKLKKIPIHNSDKITFADITFEVKNAD